MHENSGRAYSVTYVSDSATPAHGSISLWFSTSLNEDEDMSPVCGMDVEAYRVGLEAIGYKSEGRGIYHHSSSEIPPFFYRRGQIAVSVRVAGESEQNPEHLCVTTIDVGFGG